MTEEKKQKRYSVTLGGPYIKCLNQLVNQGIFSTEQEAIRDALRDLFERHGFEPFKPFLRKVKTPELASEGE